MFRVLVTAQYDGCIEPIYELGEFPNVHDAVACAIASGQRFVEVLTPHRVWLSHRVDSAGRWLAGQWPS